MPVRCGNRTSPIRLQLPQSCMNGLDTRVASISRGGNAGRSRIARGGLVAEAPGTAVSHLYRNRIQCAKIRRRLDCVDGGFEGSGAPHGIRGCGGQGREGGQGSRLKLLGLALSRESRVAPMLSRYWVAESSVDDKARASTYPLSGISGFRASGHRRRDCNRVKLQ